MSKKYRQILELLTISDYRKHYQIKKVKTIKLPKIFQLWVWMFVAILIITSCNGEQKKPESTPTPIENTAPVSSKKSDKKVILFYGNSLTAGYGLDPSESFPSNIETMIDSLNLPYQVVNAGLSGETTSGGLKRIDWVMNQQVDIFILELGANDMLRGLPLAETRKNLQGIIDKVKATDPNIKIGLCEMMAAPNMGSDYVSEFSKIYADLAANDDVLFFPFFLEGVAGNPDLLLPDGKHPNADGQEIVAATIWKTLKGML